MPGPEGNWRVERELPASAEPKEKRDEKGEGKQDDKAEEKARVLSEMKEELVYRVFAELIKTGSKECEAVKEFSKGLRAYRRTLATDMNKIVNLRKAEGHFFAARSHDKNFTRCSYNLGVVYRQLDFSYEQLGTDKKQNYMDAAKAAFERAISDDPANAEAAYALSLSYQRTGPLEQALAFAERAITHAPRDIRAWNMKGLIWRHVQPDPGSPAAWRPSLKFRGKAAALAWRDLCCTAWRGQNLDGPRTALSHPFQNLAVAHLQLNHFRRGIRILRQAIGQQPNASLYFELGKGLQAQARGCRIVLLGALKAFRSAANFAEKDTERALYHAYIAGASARIATFLTERFLPEFILRRIGPGGRTAREAYEQAYRKALTSPSSIDEKARKQLKDACETLRDVHRRRVIGRIGEKLDALKPQDHETNSERLKRFRRVVKNSVPLLPEAPDVITIIDWKRAVLAIEIGKLLMEAKPTQRRYKWSEHFLKEGVSLLEDTYPEEESLVSANERLAEALRMQFKFTEALASAKKAVALNPFSTEAIRQLGLAYFNLANYDEAERELQKSFAQNPADAQTLQFIGLIPWNRGAALTKREDRESEFRKVIKTFDQAVDLANTDNYPGGLHFWLGRFHGDLKEYDSSAKHYEMAKALKTYPVECRLYLGWEGIEQELFDKSESHLRDALSEIFQSRRAAREQDKRSGKPPKSPADLWRMPLEGFSEGKIPPGYFLLNICLLLALVFTERGRDIKRAKRWLGFVDQHMHILGEPPPLAERDERVRYEVRSREIKARYKDYLGWVCHLDGDARQAREHIEASVKMRENPESLSHLARVYLDSGEMDRALEYCDRARTADIRGVFEAHIAKIEAMAKAARDKPPIPRSG